jgi:hypothetical protein
MSCSPFDLKDYFFGELAREERRAVEMHVAVCGTCREELDALALTRGALLSVTEEEPPRRIAFVSDKVFEPKWYHRLWSSGPRLGFASACVLAGAIVFHAQRAPQPVQQTPIVAQIDQTRLETELARRVDSAVAQAVAATEQRQAARMLDVVNARMRTSEREHRADLAAIQEILMRMHKEAALARRAAYYAPVGVSQ